MNDLNANAIVFAGWCTCVGALLGSWLWGLTIGLTILLRRLETMNAPAWRDRLPRRPPGRSS